MNGQKYYFLTIFKPLLFKSLSDVYLHLNDRAAQYIANMEFTYYLPDLVAACENECDSTTKAAMEQAIGFLWGI